MKKKKKKMKTNLNNIKEQSIDKMRLSFLKTTQNEKIKAKKRKRKNKIK